ncbi:MAG: hypothetical protein JWO71_3408 [Candidatus Acidoferrum typicum]|nr:hypothetical protein [Candidatus Acidoferrum typicum]
MAPRNSSELAPNVFLYDGLIYGVLLSHRTAFYFISGFVLFNLVLKRARKSEEGKDRCGDALVIRLLFALEDGVACEGREQ